MRPLFGLRVWDGHSGGWGGHAALTNGDESNRSPGSKLLDEVLSSELLCIEERLPNLFAS